jgi:hypothetical protein
MKESWVSKSLVLIIILLFIGVAVAPSINQSVVTASQDDDLVEVTTQACGIKGFGDTTVKLTREQYQNLEQYLIEFKARLNQTSTREEAIPLFKQAVIELDTYGLLPKGMNTKQAQHLVTRENHDTTPPQVVINTVRRQHSRTATNSFCLLAGLSNNTEMITLYQWILVLGSGLIGEFFYNFHLPLIIYLWIIILLVGTTSVFYELDYLRPLVVWSDIYIHGGSGFLFTLGLGGLKTWSGSFSGKISGFTGIKILLNLRNPSHYFYLGSARLVNASSEPVC